MGRHTVDILCRCCKKPGKHAGRGLIIACHSRHYYRGTLDQYPLTVTGGTAWTPTGRIGTETLRRYMAMDKRGFSPARIRFELGLSPRQVYRYAKAARERREQLAATELITERQSA
ncbi:hypothetical protein [Streptosporangium sp. NPDC006930]|uniref:hypothetical protein n=1 Tax=Streptosporangium sp. NPDC006930 TaxID=3154783 RepID=UPI0034195A82